MLGANHLRINVLVRKVYKTQTDYYEGGTGSTELQRDGGLKCTGTDTQTPLEPAPGVAVSKQISPN